MQRTLLQKDEKSVDSQDHDPDGNRKYRKLAPRLALFRNRLSGRLLRRNRQLRRLNRLDDRLGY